MAAICRSTIIKESTPLKSEWALRSLRNDHAVYVGIGTPLISEWLRRSAGICTGLNAIPGVTCHVPKGTFYAWAKIELDGKNSQEIADYLLEEAGVATVPGDAYGLGGTCCIRMSFATAEGDLREALRRMDAAIREING